VAVSWRVCRSRRSWYPVVRPVSSRWTRCCPLPVHQPLLHLLAAGGMSALPALPPAPGWHLAAWRALRRWPRSARRSPCPPASAARPVRDLPPGYAGRPEAQRSSSGRHPGHASPSRATPASTCPSRWHGTGSVSQGRQVCASVRPGPASSSPPKNDSTTSAGCYARSRGCIPQTAAWPAPDRQGSRS
jgi:hypothetical protein